MWACDTIHLVNFEIECTHSKRNEEYFMLFLNREEGQGLVEYGFVLILVAVVIVGVLTLLGPQIGNIFSRVIVCVPPTAACS